MEPMPHQPVRVRRFTGDGHAPRDETDLVAAEEPLEIRVGGQSVAITMRTPGHDRFLAAGFLLAEGIVSKPADIIEIAPCLQGEAAQAGNVLNVFLDPAVGFDPTRLTRHTFGSSSCGVCGKATIESLQQTFPKCDPPAEGLLKLLPSFADQMRASQSGFTKTGGSHSAALFDAEGRMRSLFEDVGRHNALDKLLGQALLQGWLPLRGHVVLVSGRSSFEMVQKAWAGGVSALVSVSAPTSLAVQLAHSANITLVGFLRSNTFNLYFPKTGE